MPTVLFSNRTYQLTFLVLMAALAWTFYHRAEYFDEAWFAEQSFWLIRDGNVRSELFRDYNSWHDGIYVFHKLFIYAGALVMSVTGVSVATSKLVSIASGLAGGWLIWFYGRHRSREQQWVALLLYVGCGALIRYISVNRPETMCITLGFASYVALDRSDTKSSQLALAGMLAGLAALTHLNGLIYLTAGAIWLLIKRDWRSTALFIVTGTVTLSLYALDALLDGQLPMMIDQFRNDPATQGNLGLMRKLTVMADYHQIFFHSQNEGALSGLVILCAIAFRKRIRLTQPIWLYTILLVLSFWLLTKSDTDVYFLLFLPCLSILAADWLVTYLPVQPAWQTSVARIMLIAYGVIAFAQQAWVLEENKDLPDTETHNALLASYMPRKHTRIIAPLHFFFGQMDNYQVRGLTYYHLINQAEKIQDFTTFFQQAQRNNIEYIIIDYPIHIPARLGAYRRVFQDEWNTVYARQR